MSKFSSCDFFPYDIFKHHEYEFSFNACEHVQNSLDDFKMRFTMGIMSEDDQKTKKNQ